ncbi:MAG: hypothetical protein GY869_28475 [Planctomycetes bacterium]|nr:hypothetical protein [Planctomycetota bacterium]
MGLLSKYLVNPRIEIDVKADIPYTLRDFHMSFDIEKNLEEDENECELTIYNLNESQRAALASGNIQSLPIEVFLTPAGKAEKNPLGGFDLVSAFLGEVDNVTSRRARPGYETVINLLSQKDNHRAFNIEPKTFKKGTPKAAVITFLAAAVNLPLKIIGTLPVDVLLLSASFSGPAFPLLKNFCRGEGLYAYITDGVLSITSSKIPPNPVPRELFKAHMLDDPNLTTRMDSADIEMRTIVESTTINPFAKVRKKKKKRSKVIGANDYVEYQAVEKQITGVDYSLLCQPDIRPDDLVVPIDHLKFLGHITRVQSVHMYGDNFGGDWNSDLKTDDLDTGLL